MGGGSKAAAYRVRAYSLSLSLSLSLVVAGCWSPQASSSAALGVRAAGGDWRRHMERFAPQPLVDISHGLTRIPTRSGSVFACQNNASKLIPCTATTSAIVNAQRTKGITLQNISTNPQVQQYTLSCSRSAGIASCSVPTGIIQLSQGQQYNFNLTYVVGGSPSIDTILVQAGENGSVVEDTLFVNVVNLALTPDGIDTLVAPGASPAVTFKLSNQDTQHSLALDLATQCGVKFPAGACTPSPTPVTLAPSGQPGSQQTATVTLNALAGTDTGTVKLRAKAANTTDVLDTGWVRVGKAQGTAGPYGGSVIVAPNQLGQQLTFTFQNGAPLGGRYDYTVGCSYTGTNPGCAPTAGQTSILAGTLSGQPGQFTRFVTYTSGSPGDTVGAAARFYYGGVYIDSGYQAVYVAGTTVTTASATAVEPPGTSRTLTFSVQNRAKVGVTYDLLASCYNAASGGVCSVAPTLTLGAAPANANVTVTYQTATAGDSGTVRLLTRYAGVDLDAGKVSVRLAKATVTPTGTPISLAVNTAATQNFTINNTGLDTTTFDLSASCNGQAMGATCAFPSNPEHIFLSPNTNAVRTLNFSTSATPSVSGSGAGVARYKTVYIDSGWIRVTTLAQANIVVTPAAQAVQRAVNTAIVDTFHVKNNLSVARTIALTASCAPGGSFASCASNGSTSFAPLEDKVVTISYVATATGGGKTVTLTATSGTDTGNGHYDVTVNSQYVTLARAGLTDSNYIAARCAVSCYTARQALSTVPYVSQGQPRSITLVYDGDQLAVRPIVQLTASVGTGGPATAGYQVSAKDSAGATITFVNGETTLRFAGGLSAGAAATLGRNSMESPGTGRRGNIGSRRSCALTMDSATSRWTQSASGCSW